MFFRLAVSSSSKRARGASNFNSAILPAMSLIIEREGVNRGRDGEFGVAAERVSRFRRPRRGTDASPPFTRRDRENRDDVDDATEHVGGATTRVHAHTLTHTRSRARAFTHTRTARNVRAITPVDTS